MRVSSNHTSGFEPLPLTRVKAAAACSDANSHIPVFARTLVNDQGRTSQYQAMADARRRAALTDPGQHIAILTEEIEALRAEHAAALAQARADGFQAGRTQAATEQTAALVSSIIALNSGLANIEQNADLRQREMVADAAVLAMDVADHLAGSALSREPLAGLQSALDTLLAEAGWSKPLSIFIHPTLASTFIQQLGDFSGSAWRPSVEVFPDAKLAIGDARVEWPGGGLCLNRGHRRAEVLAALATVIPDLNILSEDPAIEVRDRAHSDHTASDNLFPRDPAVLTDLASSTTTATQPSHEAHLDAELIPGLGIGPDNGLLPVTARTVMPSPSHASDTPLNGQHV